MISDALNFNKKETVTFQKKIALALIDRKVLLLTNYSIPHGFFSSSNLIKQFLFQNLDNWKSCRRKRVEHIIDRVVEVKKLELEEHDRARKKSKTFSEMMEDR